MEVGNGPGFFGFVLAVGFFIFFSYCLKLICQKAEVDPGIMMIIPVVNIAFIPLLAFT